MIQVQIIVDHGHGQIRIEEVETHPGQSEEAVVRGVQRAAARATKRAECAITAKES